MARKGTQAVGTDALRHVLLADTTVHYLYIRREVKEKVTGENYSLYIFISIKARCLRWAGYAACRENARTAYKIMIGNFVGEKRAGISKRRYGLGTNEVEYGILVGFREHADELLGPIKRKVFLVQLNNHKLIKKTLVG